ncbi:DUF3180 domain-containing protein [Humibacter ginsenosidimutans]|uniref:DUF3180 domain-containing protein n=1 Tax=Humibacter ginsenosidimutans TaxID=2599293 RepID=A0A5B8M6K4_9MICO|nr:DUF3180 domain-containing protein [Humibacter ginsenosidimutans]QDZ15140.1 DUF3180 domain-containing protein [Humibacter ginsenosidimutans]
MRRTGAIPLIALGVIGVVIGYLLEIALVAAGASMLIPPVSLSITLVAIAVIVVLFAIPIRRAVHSKVRVHVDPFRAMRVAVLAKACSLVGALLTGTGVGIVIYVLTRPIPATSDAVWLSVVAAVSAVILLVAGLIAEFFCTLPPPQDDDAERAEHAPAR